SLLHYTTLFRSITLLHQEGSGTLGDGNPIALGTAENGIINLPVTAHLAGDVVIVARAEVGGNEILSNPLAFKIVPGAVHQVSIDVLNTNENTGGSPSNLQLAGEPFALRLTLKDIEGNVVSNLPVKSYYIAWETDAG